MLPLMYVTVPGGIDSTYASLHAPVARAILSLAASPHYVHSYRGTASAYPHPHPHIGML